MDPLRDVRNRLLNGWQLSKLYTFEVAARHQSFALAADELSLSPSAVSHRINQLEEELGIQLFVRSHRKVELTHEGKRVFWALKSSLEGNSGHQKPGAFRHAHGLFAAVHCTVLAGTRVG